MKRSNTRNKQNNIMVTCENRDRKKNLWKGSAAEPIARETLFLPRDREGLGLLVSLILGQARRLKYILQLGKKENITSGRILEDTVYLPRYAILHLIGNFYEVT